MKRLVVLAAVGIVAGCGRAEAPKEVANSTNAEHCLNALIQAGEAGSVDPDRSALIVPWKITGSKSPEGHLRLRCEVSNADYRAWLTADVICDDPDREECVSLVDVETARELAIPSARN